MKKTILTMALTIALSAFTTAAKAFDVEKTIPVAGSFDKISTTGSMDIIYTQGSKHSVKITGTAEDVEKVKVTVKDGKLSIEPKMKAREMGGVIINTTSFKKDVKIKVTSPKLRLVEITGSGDFTANGTIKTDKLDLEITGSGDIDIKKAAASKLTASIAGSGDIDIDNITSCGNAILSVAGSGEIEARLDNCQNVKCSVAGSGEIKVKGKAVNYSSSIAGSGEIDRKELTVTGNVSESTTTTTTTTNINNTQQVRTANGIVAMP